MPQSFKPSDRNLVSIDIHCTLMEALSVCWKAVRGRHNSAHSVSCDGFEFSVLDIFHGYKEFYIRLEERAERTTRVIVGARNVSALENLFYYQSVANGVVFSIKLELLVRSPHNIIFISYRRQDSADLTGRVFDRLIECYGKDAVFRDVDNIPLGVNFLNYMKKVLGECKIMLGVIGTNWLHFKNQSGKRCLDDPEDYVRLEIEFALTNKIPIIPLLVGGSTMPLKKELPSSLDALTLCNGLPIRPDPDFENDIKRLISNMDQILGSKHPLK